MEWIKRIYIYLFSAIGLVLVIIGSVQLVNLALKAWVFTKADTYVRYPIPMAIEGEKTAQPSQEELETYEKEERSAQRQRQAASALAMMIVGTPLFLYHWSIARKRS